MTEPGHGADGAHQVVHAGHPLLEQVGPARRAVLEQRYGVGGRGVLAQHHHPHLRAVLAQPGGGLDALVPAGGRHADVGDHDVGLAALDEGEQLGQVGRGADELEVRVGGDQPGDALPQEDVVLGQRNPDGAHGA